MAKGREKPAIDKPFCSAKGREKPAMNKPFSLAKGREKLAINKPFSSAKGQEKPVTRRNPPSNQVLNPGATPEGPQLRVKQMKSECSVEGYVNLPPHLRRSSAEG